MELPLGLDIEFEQLLNAYKSDYYYFEEVPDSEYEKIADNFDEIEIDYDSVLTFSISGVISYEPDYHICKKGRIDGKFTVEDCLYIADTCKVVWHWSAEYIPELIWRRGDNDNRLTYSEDLENSLQIKFVEDSILNEWLALRNSVRNSVDSMNLD